MFNCHTTHTSAHYTFSPLICLLCTKFRLPYTADKQTFQATVQQHCLSAKPTFQSLWSLGNVIICDLTEVFMCVISGFCQEGDENCVLLCYYAACSGFPKTMIKNYHYSLCKNLEEYSSQFLFVPARNFFEQYITWHPLVLTAVICSFQLSSHTFPYISSVGRAIKLNPKLYYVPLKCQKRYLR
jgi:hypothetical protein